MNAPLITFIVLTRRRPARLSGALESILRQTVTSREAVVVVNGQDPDTEQLLQSHAAWLRTTILDANYGVGAGRNVGITQAQGEILFFLDDDAELPDPDAAKRVQEHFDRDVDLGVVGLCVIDASTRTVERRCLPFTNKRVPSEVRPACYFAGGACAIRRRVFDRVGLYDESLFYGGEEIDLSYRLLEAGFRIIFDPSLVVLHYGVRVDRGAIEAYYFTRNRPWVALRHLPLWCVASHCMGWWMWGVARGFREQRVTEAMRGIRDCVAKLPAIWRSRRPISRQTRQLLTRENGRFWF